MTAKKKKVRKKVAKKAVKKSPAKAANALPMADPANARRFTANVYRRLEKHFGIPDTPLTYQKPHELCLAVILSAQCTDEQVNKTTPDLFARFPEPEDYARASLGEIEKYIYSTGFYKNKAKSLQGFCRVLIEEHNGLVPSDPEVLRKMPGVGRKTANVIQQELFDEASGIVVDTHVARICGKVLGLTQQKDPTKIERDLVEVVDRKYWRYWALYIIFLGRFCCTARKRDCSICPLKTICPSSEA
jgi:endonuclease-3